MKWSEIITQVRDKLQEQSEAFFSNERLMDTARRVQAEVAAVTECLETEEETSVSAGCIECPLPDDCLNVLYATFDDRPLSRVDIRRLDRKEYPSGSPAMYYIFGGKAGLYPAAAAAGTLKLWYSQRPSLGVFSIINDGSGGANAATVVSESGSLTLTITGGSNAGSDSFDYSDSSTDTIGGLAAAINTLDKGWRASRIAGCRASEPSRNIEDAGARSAFQKQLTVDSAVKLPEEFQTLIELGTIYRAMWKDTEFEAGNVYKQEYLERLDAMRRVFSRRGTRRGPSSVRDVYSNNISSPAGIRLYIP